MDHFERLGLPRRFVVDAAALQPAYFERSRLAHPDFHGLASAADQSASLRESAALNDAYATLADPLKRGEYLHQLLGGPAPDADKSPDPAFLMEAMELREAAETDRGPAGVAIRAAEARELGRLTGLFDAVPVDLAATRRTLNRLRTLASLAREARPAS